MNSYLIVLFAVLPVVLLLFYIYKKDIDKEPRGTLKKVFLGGMATVIPVCIIELFVTEDYPTEYIPSFYITFLTVFVTIGIVEELFKWLVVYKWVYKRLEFNHVYDGIVYGVFASLGFACVENICYLFQYGATSFWEVFFGRFLMAVPSHATDGIFMGVLFSLSKQALIKKDNGKALLYLICSILIPAITHSVYDALAIYASSYETTYYFIFFITFIILTYIVSFVLINNFSKVNKNFDGTLVNEGKGDTKNEKEIV